MRKLSNNINSLEDADSKIAESKKLNDVKSVSNINLFKSMDLLDNLKSEKSMFESVHPDKTTAIEFSNILKRYYNKNKRTD